LPSSRLIIYRSNFELLKELKKVANEKKLVVCFDNFTYLKDMRIVNKTLELGICIVLVGRVERDSPSLNQNILSNFPCVIRLEKYSIGQTFEILKERARLALDRSSYTDLPLKMIAEKIGGNITMALAILRAIALKAENEGKRSIKKVSLSEMLPQKDILDELNNDERIIYKILRDWKSMASSRLYNMYSQTAEYPKCERSFRTYVEHLRYKGLVKAIGKKKGRIYEIIENSGKEDPTSNTGNL
jgi:Cdc6-like AAA superfamily ATPase